MYDKPKEVSRSPRMDDNVTLTSLSPIDTLRLIMTKLTHDDSAELDNAEKLSAERLKKVGSLTKLFERATTKMNNLRKKSVTLQIASSYLPYIDEVTNQKTGLGQFYDFNYNKDTGIPASVPHFFICEVRVKNN